MTIRGMNWTIGRIIRDAVCDGLYTYVYADALAWPKDAQTGRCPVGVKRGTAQPERATRRGIAFGCARLRRLARGGDFAGGKFFLRAN